MSLEVVIGPMFSGKSTYALSYVRRQRAIGKKVLIVKPNIDKRYSKEDVLITHDQDQIPCMMWDIEYELNPSLPLFLNSDSIVIEEAQFLKGLQNAVMWLLKAYKKDILVVGLDGDALQKPFGEILDCIPWATHVTRLNAYCSICRDGTIGSYTKRKNPENITEQICVGGADMYDAVCLKHLL
jgi:thymidine kinase